MKFTKVIARAFANKVYKSLSNAREENVKNFVLTGEEAEKAKDLIFQLYELTSKLDAVNAELSKLHNNFYKRYNESPEDGYKRLVNLMAETRVPRCPEVEDLVDEFLIESVDAVNAEELISKILAKHNG